MELHKDVEYVMIGKEEIAARVKTLAAELDERYAGEPVLAVCILKGSTVFFADLIREMKTPLTVDFMAASSYGNGTTSGTLTVKMDLGTYIEGKNVLLVEDIMDTGRTLYKIREMLSTRGAKSVDIVTLLDKPSRRQAEIEPDFTGFVIEDKFVIGYGLDYAELYRNLPYIGILKPCVYEK